jgi:hypothetical protein
MSRAFFILSILLLATISHGQEINLENELVAFYPLDGNAQNSVTDSFHGIETNVEYRSNRNGVQNSCCYLLGVDSYITIPHVEELNWDARTESYSILLWIRSDYPILEGQNRGRLFTKWRELLAEPYPYSFQYNEQELSVAIYDASAGYAVQFHNVWDDQWHFVAMVFDHESSTLISYLDGVMIDSQSIQLAGSTTNTADIFLGRGLSPVYEGFYKGYCDDIYFYNRVLKACEIEALYSGQLLNER